MYLYSVNIPFKHDKLVELETKVKDAAIHHELAMSDNDKLKEKAQRLKKKLQKDVVLSESEYMEILSEVQEYELNVKKVEDSMKKSKTKFLEAHGTTLEVLKVSNEIEISDERFSRKGERKYKCIFCTMRFDRWELRKHHILMYHWSDNEERVCIHTIMFLSIILFYLFNICKNKYIYLYIFINFYFNFKQKRDKRFIRKKQAEILDNKWKKSKQDNVSFFHNEFIICNFYFNCNGKAT